MQQLTGVRGRLLFAFFSISAFSVFAAVTAMYAFLEVGKNLEEITLQRVPAALASQNLSHQAERVVAVAPALLSVDTHSDHEALSQRITIEVERLNGLLFELENSGSSNFISLIEPAVVHLVGNLQTLEDVVYQQIEAGHYKQTLLDQFSNTHIATRRLLSPGLLVLESNLARLRKTTEEMSPGSDRQYQGLNDIVRSVADSYLLQKAQFEVAAINDSLLRAAVAQQAELAVMIYPLNRSLASLKQFAGNMDEGVRSRMLKRAEEFQSFISGPNSILKARERELEIASNGRQLIKSNADLAGQLTTVVDQLVTTTSREILQANQKVASIQRTSTWMLLSAVCLSLLSSILIVWLYVGRSLTRRLTGLSDSMLAIARGKLDTTIPAGGNDEISDMARALLVFRDTAVEVRETNLRELRDMRHRLDDAIGSISEGFSLYDADDCLVICNKHYREFFYPGISDLVVPGAPFEDFVRGVADRGLIKDAQGREHEWIAERMKQHLHPNGPLIQRQNDGRWFQIDERKTADGGTVAIYTDITGLKDREQQLAEKSTALEQLSRQLAKYLPPQVYDSIFQGRQEVKVASSRKKLTIFFSDLAGFTQLADQLASEDLTRLLNHYLTEMSQIALDHGGTIDKYMGDAILVFFGDPESRGAKEDALACVNMAIAMQKRLRELVDIWRNSGIDKSLGCRMGINTDYCTVGNFGSENRLDYTIIGRGVNIASRLETMGKPGEILISYETYAHIRDEICCKEHEQIEVKGQAYPIATYWVIDSYENLQIKRHHFHEHHAQVKVDLDLDAMDREDRDEAEQVLSRAMEQLKQEQESKKKGSE